jgi:CBS domain containing-hemolysin-like protein
MREFMVPRTELEAVEVTAPMPEVHAKFVETELSRILVYGETLDEVLGYVHSSALLQDPQPQSLADVLQAVLVVPETMSADMLLREFNTQRMSVAVVVDEFGGTSGLVTVEDLVEVVFGEIDDELDEEEDDDLVMDQLDDRTWLISARVDVEEANEEFDLSLPEDEGDYNTLGGLFLHVAERIPEEGDTVDIGAYRLTVVRAGRNRIETLKVERMQEAEEG